MPRVKARAWGAGRMSEYRIDGKWLRRDDCLYMRTSEIVGKHETVINWTSVQHFVLVLNHCPKRGQNCGRRPRCHIRVSYGAAVLT